MTDDLSADSAEQPVSGAITLHFTYTETDYVRAVRLRNRRRAGGRFDLVAGLGVTAFGAVTWWHEGYSSMRAMLVALGLLFLAMLVATEVVLPRWWFRREPKLQDPYTLTFSDTGIDFRTSRIHSQLEWALYHGFAESPTTYLLLYGHNQFSAIPKRVFESPEQEARFKVLVAAKLGAAARP
jgi:hypothetical protein